MSLPNNDAMTLKTSTNWSEEEVRILRENFYSMEPGDLAAIIGRSEVAIQSKANTLGLYRRYKPVKNETTIQRPPAEYSNTTREDLLNKYASANG